jgi:hypothetical protein
MRCDTPLNFFELLFDEKLIDLIVKKTNKYQAHSNEDKVYNANPHQAKWIPTNNFKIYTLLATIMLTLVTRKNKIYDYWSADPMIATPMFGQLISRDRFLSLLRYLYFNDNSNQIDDDKLHKIKPVIDELRKKIKLLVHPYKDLCIDESLMPWKGRVIFKQYILTKRCRFGVKTFIICDCQTGTVLDCIVYTMVLLRSYNMIRSWEYLVL